MTLHRHTQRGGIALIASLQLLGCATRPLAVLPLAASARTDGSTASEPLYSIHNGIKPTNTSSITPKAWKRAQEFCKGFGKQPQEVQVGQQWPPVRDFVFSCVPPPDRNRR
jgi:hypothetical protein